MQTLEQLQFGNIIGIVDSYGAVHSRFTGNDVKHHSEFWPTQTFCRWRWNNREGIHVFRAGEKFNDEQFDAIQRHLTRKFSIKWMENGYHTLEHLNKQKKGKKPT